MMFKIYHFSNSDLSYKTIGRTRLLAMIVLPIIISSAFTTYMMHLGFDPLGIRNLQMGSFSKENSKFRAQLISLNGRLNHVKNYMERLGRGDELLRTSVNLPPISPDARKASIGGTEENTDYGVSPTANSLISGAAQTLDLLNRMAKIQEDSYADILNKCKSNQRVFAHMPAIDPIRGGAIEDGFGIRYHPILHMRLMHEGVDIIAPLGTHVYATGDGVVSYVGRRGGYGNVVEIDNGFGYTTLFAHLKKALVTDGAKIKRGQVIGLVGDTGLSTGPHLHYGVMKNGIFVDPELYFFSNREYNVDGLYDTAASN
jgi:murein DD-endopeptidase MepM/ murein hydrolase activator NlpD